MAAAKTSALEDGIVKLEDELESEDLTPEEREDIRAKIKELEVQRNEQRDHLRVDIEPKLRSQINRIRETVYKMRYEDTTLGERIRTLFREQGITIASLITAIGMTITAIAEGIKLATRKVITPKPKPPGPKPEPGPSPPPKPKTFTEWIKAQLEKIANLLLKLGDKVIAALPGIIGAVVSFVLKSASAAVGFIAEHLWILALTIGGIIYKEKNDRR